MSLRLQITCVNKRDPNDVREYIRRIGGAGWKHTEEEAINNIDNDVCSYYIKRTEEVVDVIVTERAGRRYLKTMLDADQPDNLLHLPECPADKNSQSANLEYNV